MAKIYPFQPWRYTPKAGPLDQLVTQPYDKITPEMRSRYLALSPYNLVRVILGERKPSDSPSDNVYTRAARHMSDWIAAGILEQDAEPGFYAYFQEFESPDSGERLIRKGFIGLGAVEDYAEGTVHRHEQTLSGPKQDRLELLRHTRAHFGQIFMLYPDPKGEIDAILDAASGAQPAACVTDEYGAVHKLWKISAPDVIARICELMADKKLLIADGHHRYETALAFRNENPGLEGARKVMMTFVNMHSDGLKILATHRVVHGLKTFDSEAFLRAVREKFRVAPLGSLDELRRAWAEEHQDTIRIGVALPAGIHLLDAPRQPGVLDVSFLHQEMLEKVLGLSEADIREQKHLRYIRGVEAAVDEVRTGAGQAAFLLEPVPVSEVARIAFSGGVMPQKSTDFYPKLLSGLTIYRIEQPRPSAHASRIAGAAVAYTGFFATCAGAAAPRRRGLAG
ncbi:MAG TPA: DUF1015 domain-containing protein [Bryobacteraceae bacterium]|nr:DUF1015 domain-containing protein [Bryobacteraceae bacterium]HPU74147.1 DUF1015 domain-containing protein [Bryobacteraceae bacterium]